MNDNVTPIRNNKVFDLAIYEGNDFNEVILEAMTDEAKKKIHELFDIPAGCTSFHVAHLDPMAVLEMLPGKWCLKEVKIRPNNPFAGLLLPN